MEIKIRI